MHAAMLIVPPPTRSAAVSRGTTRRSTTDHQDRRRRLLLMLAGPANTPSLHRARPARRSRSARRHDCSTRTATETDHR
jgi:hypothetical protein